MVLLSCRQLQEGATTPEGRGKYLEIGLYSSKKNRRHNRISRRLEEFSSE